MTNVLFMDPFYFFSLDKSFSSPHSWLEKKYLSLPDLLDILFIEREFFLPTVARCLIIRDC